MKKRIVLIIVAVVVGIMLISSYNGLVRAEEEVDSIWANVESSYQRRADLIPNIVNTVQGQANFERDTLTNVINARAKASQTNIDPANMTQEQLNWFQQQQNAVGSALSRLLVTVERYPQLKAHQGFLNLQAQLEGTENRINKARNDFNTSAKTYNSHIRQFPTKFVAILFGFKQKPYFQAAERAEYAPTVSFN